MIMNHLRSPQPSKRACMQLLIYLKCFKILLFIHLQTRWQMLQILICCVFMCIQQLLFSPAVTQISNLFLYFVQYLMQTIKILHRASQKAFCLHPISLLFITSLIIVLYDTTSNLLRHCAASQKVTSSIPDGVTGISH